MASTLVLMVLALGVALAPIAIRYFDRRTVTRIVVVADDDRLAAARPSASPTACSTSRRRAPTRRPGRSRSCIEQRDRPADGRARAGQLGEIGGIILVERAADGQLVVTYRTERPGGQRAQPDGRIRGRRDGHPRLDVRRCRLTPSSHRSRPRASRSIRLNVADRRRPSRSTSRRCASRSFLGHRLRRAPVHHRRHLRHVGGDRRRGREEQSGHGADDQRRLAAPAADRARSSGSGWPA